jgi:hypothetical protein
MAFFYNTSFDASTTCIPTCLDADEPKYASVEGRIPETAIQRGTGGAAGAATLLIDSTHIASSAMLIAESTPR